MKSAAYILLAASVAGAALLAGAGQAEAAGAAGAAGAQAGHPALPVSRAAATAVPGAPFLDTVVPEGLGALASWTPNPVFDHVTTYSVSPAVAAGYAGKVPAGCASPPAASAPGSDSSVVVSGLCAQIPYTLTMTAANSAGSSAPSAPSNPVVPLVAQPPSAPLIVSVLARNKALLVTWTAPALSGGDPLLGYTLTATAGSVTVTTHPGSSVTQASVTGLADGTRYAVSLTADSKAGLSAAASGSGTPSAPYAPAPPMSLRAVANGSGGLAVTWLPPADNGGDSILQYKISYQQEVPKSGGGWITTGHPHSLTVAGSVTTVTIPALPAHEFFGVRAASISAAGQGTAASTSTPVAPTIGLAPNAVVLSAATMSALTSAVGGTLTWPAPAPAQVQSLKTGDVLVGTTTPATPEGLLARVFTVTKDASGNYAVQTAAARLSDAFTNLSISQSGNPLQMQAAQFQPMVPGIRVITSAPGISISPHLSLAINLSAGPVKVSGSLDINPDLEFSWEINHGFLGIPDGISVAASASVNAKFAATATLSGPARTWYLGLIPTPPIDVQIGPVPVILDPKIPIFLEADGKINVAVSASMTFGAGLTWSTADPGTLNTQNLSKPFILGGGPLPGVSVAASAALTLQAFPQIDIYNVTGPDIEADAKLEITANYKPPPGTPYFEIAPTLTLKAGWYIDLSLGPFSLNAKLETTLATLNFRKFEIANEPNADLVVSPANPAVTPGSQLTFTASRSDGQHDPVTWTVQGAETGDSIDQNGVLSVAAPGGRTLTVVALDSTGAIGQTSVYVGSQFDPPGAVQVTAIPGGTSANVTWTAPVNTGGGPIASYTLVTEPPTQTLTLGASATSAQLTGLVLNTPYLVSVYATDTLGLRSPPAWATVTPHLPQAQAWGYNADGELGNGTTGNPGLVPAPVSNLTGLASVTGGSYGGYALRSDGTAWAWGANSYGQLGNGTTTSSPVPVQVSNLTGITGVSGSAFDSNGASGYAVRSDGTAWAWGYNLQGELGNGTTTSSPVPVQVSNLTGVVAVAGGANTGYALRSDGTAWAWGSNNFGDLGNGTSAGSLVPVQVSSLTGVVAISGGNYDGYALRSDGTVWAWGANYAGQLGNGTTTGSPVPVQVSSLTGVIAISGGADASYALRSDGTVWAWGYNAEGQLGNGTTTSSSVPVEVSSLTGVIAVSGGAYGGYALRPDGTVWAWGDNFEGELGNGTTTSSLVPVQVSGISTAYGIGGGSTTGYALTK
jgi:alpha-tubulin suppressor-like RCC1 family protein